MHVVGRLVEPIWTRIQLPCRNFSTMATNVYKLGGDNCVEAEWRRLCKSLVAANVYKLGGGNCVEAKWRRLRGGDCVKAGWRRMCTS